MEKESYLIVSNKTPFLIKGESKMAKIISKAVKVGLTESIQTLIEVIDRSLEDARKFDAGNNAAGKRVRTALKDIPKKLKVIKAISLGKEV